MYVCLSMLAEKLNMTNEEAEKWIVDLIRNARLDAKIDSKLVRFISRLYKFVLKIIYLLFLNQGPRCIRCSGNQSLPANY